MTTKGQQPMTPTDPPYVDAAPFAARQAWTSTQELELWWEDPRDVQRVVLRAGSARAPALFYWRSSWPGVRVPKGAVVGAGESGWLREMFLCERGQDLWIGQAVPRAWFEHGKTMAVERAATHFGPASLRFDSQAGTGGIRAAIDPPKRNPPARIRHPQGKPMQSVWIDGLPHTQFDPLKEVIVIERKEEAFEVRVLY